MKHLLLRGTWMVGLLGLLACGCESARDTGGTQWWMSWSDGQIDLKQHHDNGRMTTIASWSDDDVDRSVRAEGAIEFTPDDRDVILMTPESSLQLTEDGTVERELRIHVVAGATTYEYEENGRAHGFEGGAVQWYVTVLHDVLSKTPIGAEARAQRIIAEGGENAVYDELSRLEISRVKAIYLNALIHSDLSETLDYPRLVHFASENVSSSSSLSELIQTAALRKPDSEPFTTQLIAAANQLSSSSAKVEALTKIAEVRPLTPQRQREWLLAVRGVSSSSGQKTLLTGFAPGREWDAETFDVFVETATAVSSSTRQREILGTAMEESTVPASGWSSILGMIPTVSSSSAQGDLVSQAIQAMPPDPALQRQAIGVISEISSTSVQGRAFDAILGTDMQGDVIKELAAAVEDVSSSSTRSRLQQKIIDVLASRDG